TARLGPEHVQYTYCGVRPLPYTTSRDESTITRSHFVVDHAKRGGPQGLLSVVGGKLTTYRSLARIAVASIEKLVPPPHPSRPEPKRTARPGNHYLSGDVLSVYGERANEVREVAAADRTLGERICAHNPEI